MQKDPVNKALSISKFVCDRAAQDRLIKFYCSRNVRSAQANV